MAAGRLGFQNIPVKQGKLIRIRIDGWVAGIPEYTPGSRGSRGIRIASWATGVSQYISMRKGSRGIRIAGSAAWTPNIPRGVGEQGD